MKQIPLPGCEGVSDEGQTAVEPLLKQPRIKPINRRQMILRPMDIESLIPEDHEARAIWELTGSLDLSAYYQEIKAVEGEAGSSAFDPQLLVSLWIYAYSKGVSSAREVSRLCTVDSAYQWLTANQPINHHTLSDFRGAHEESLRELFVEVLGILSHEGLVTLERVMQDGAKVKASAGVDTFRKEDKLRAHLEAAREQVRAMEQAGEEEISPRVKKARERAIREREERLAHALGELEKIRRQKRSRQERVSTSDPECRIMSQSDGGYAPSYNVQVSTDAAHKVVVAVSVSQAANDQGLLEPALEEVEKAVGRLPEQVVVDGGFTNRETILAMEEKKVDLIGSLTDSSSVRTATFRRRGVTEAFYPEAFSYDPERNVYICPQGKILLYRTKSTAKGKTSWVYRAEAEDCGGCSCRCHCCPKAKKGRSIIRLQNDPRVETFIQKMQTKEAKAIYRQRGEVAEFPMAWIKEKFGLRQFRLRGLLKVGMEAFWACLTYNVKLWIRLCWKPRLQGVGT
jgi:transposase